MRLAHMNDLSLSSAWAKVERAKEHRDALHAHIVETLAIESNRPGLGAKFDPERGENIVFVNRMPDLDRFLERCALIVGDAAHCLRSSLDHLVYQLAAKERGSRLREDQTMFVIADCRSESECRRDWKRQSERWLWQLRDDDRDIIERYQGYHRIDEQLAVGPYFHPLVMLRDLDEMDKHRLLNAVAIPSNSVSLEGDAARTVFMFGILDTTESLFAGDASDFEAKPVELGTVVARTRKIPPLETEEQHSGYMAPVVALAEGRSAVQVLDKVAATVANVIREFEPFP